MYKNGTNWVSFETLQLRKKQHSNSFRITKLKWEFQDVDDSEKNPSLTFKTKSWSVPGFPFSVECWLNYKTGEIHLQFSQDSHLPKMIGVGPLPRVTYTLWRPEYDDDLTTQLELMTTDESSNFKYVRRHELLFNESVIPDGNPHYVVFVKPSILKSLTANHTLKLELEFDYPHQTSRIEPAEGRLSWEIADYDYRKQQQKLGLVDRHSSSYFYSPKRRYRMKVDMHLVGSPYLVLRIVGGPYDQKIDNSRGFFVQASVTVRGNKSNESCYYFTRVIYGYSCRINMPPQESKFTSSNVIKIDVHVRETEELFK